MNDRFTRIKWLVGEEKFQNQLGFVYEEKGQIIYFISINIRRKKHSIFALFMQTMLIKVY
ncbi:TPA: hypothetical protein RTJ38_001012 [Campylobacter jejuni]|nr:hypothetical protein [Campylobacter jejuni]